MKDEGSVQFLNVDLLICGRFDKGPLLHAADDGVFLLHEDAVIEDKKGLLFEVADPRLDLPKTLMRLVEWVEHLPPKARMSWSRASIRRFDIGIQSGFHPHETHWRIPGNAVAALAKIGAELTLTVYGAEEPRAVRTRLARNRTSRTVRLRRRR